MGHCCTGSFIDLRTFFTNNERVFYNKKMQKNEKKEKKEKQEAKSYNRLEE